MMINEDVIRKYEKLINQLNEDEDRYIESKETIKQNLKKEVESKKRNKDLKTYENGLRLIQNYINETTEKKDLVREFLSDLYQL